MNYIFESFSLSVNVTQMYPEIFGRSCVIIKWTSFDFWKISFRNCTRSLTKRHKGSHVVWSRLSSMRFIMRFIISNISNIFLEWLDWFLIFFFVSRSFSYSSDRSFHCPEHDAQSISKKLKYNLQELEALKFQLHKRERIFKALSISMIKMLIQKPLVRSFR